MPKSSWKPREAKPWLISVPVRRGFPPPPPGELASCLKKGIPPLTCEEARGGEQPGEQPELQLSQQCPRQHTAAEHSPTVTIFPCQLSLSWMETYQRLRQICFLVEKPQSSCSLAVQPARKNRQCLVLTLHCIQPCLQLHHLSMTVCQLRLSNSYHSPRCLFSSLHQLLHPCPDIFPPTPGRCSARIVLSNITFYSTNTVSYATCSRSTGDTRRAESNSDSCTVQY